MHKVLGVRETVYDAIGNPTNDGTWQYVWQHGKQLSEMKTLDESEVITFEYNEDGLRTKKTSTSLGSTEYLLHGKNIVHMTNASHNIDIHFYYGADGKPVVMNYNGSMYGFLYNAQGDVVALFDQSGEVTVRYRYGAWGELLRCWGVEAETVGFWQPFRYRGYLWDWETGDYYCRSRQYRAEWGRFLNADELIGGNLYCYCLNSPILCIDENGRDAFWITSKSSVFGFGHTSLLLKSSDDKWYYFYWGPRYKFPIAPARVYVEEIDVRVLDGMYIDLEHLNSQLESIHGSRTSYNSATFFPGHHDRSIARAKELKDLYDESPEKEYRFLSRNCLRVSADVLAESYDDEESKRIIQNLGDQIMPNEAVVVLRNRSILPTTNGGVLFGDMKNLVR